MDKQAMVNDVLDYCNAVKVRVTYGAVGEYIEHNAQSVAADFLTDPCPRESWIVNKTTKMPTGYSATEIHPDLEGTRVLDTAEKVAIGVSRYQARIKAEQESQ